MLTRASRCSRLVRWASINEPATYLNPTINVTESPVEIANVSVEEITKIVAEPEKLGIIADSFLSIYDATASTLGVEVFVAIPIVIGAGRFALFPFYRSMRQKMPMFSYNMQRMSFIAHSQQLKILKGDFTSAEDAAHQELKMQEELGDVRQSLMKNYPIFNILPLGLFMSGNLYATWSLCRSSTAPLAFMGFENLMEFNHAAALFGTGMQLLAIKIGAELGNSTRKKSGSQELPGAEKAQATIQNVFMGLISLTYPMAYNFNCPAFISLCWAGNTCITLLFSSICLKFRSQLGIPDMDETNSKLTAEIQKIAAELVELQKIMKNDETVIGDRMQKNRRNGGKTSKNERK